ncbi:MAG: hypothetical protein DWQ01_02590 [Planctomycetota bacterium]|nr:MAG: hypothetical protein DWQ01_02590 [Planctomycetota bacterium]
MNFFARPRTLFLFTLLFLLVGSQPLLAQRLGKEWYTDRQNGFRLRYPDGWLAVPVKELDTFSGRIGQFEGPDMATRIGNQSYSSNPGLYIYKFTADDTAVTRDEEEGTGGLRGRIEKDNKRTDISEVIPRQFRAQNFEADKPVYDKDFKSKKRVEGNRRSWKVFTGQFDALLDTYTFSLDDYDIVLLMYCPEEHFKKFGKLFGQVAKTFELIEREKSLEITDASDYDQLFAFHLSEVERTPGWRLLETPSKRYLIKTSSENDKFLKEVIRRLESARDLFEREFPPAKPIEHISVVRVCSSLEEFHKYGGTGGGVAGWFSPLTTELVIVDFKNYDRNLTYGVMVHEGFHQYCHFLFDESEAHRWFDEGHGDYYAAFEFRGKKAIPKAKMKGEDRLTGIREQIRTGTYMPIGQHIRADHPTWQSRGVPSYQQSWSIVYFLRQGMDGRVPRKLWRPEYGDVIPNYMQTLHEGYLKAYDKLLSEEDAKDREEAADRIGGLIGNLIRRPKVDEKTKQEIWDAAIEASWGMVDMEEFTENWSEYVLKHVRN